MSNIKKRLFSLLLALVLVVGMIPMTASAAKDLGAAACHVLDALMAGDWERYGGRETTLGLDDGPFLSLAGRRFNSFTASQYEALLSSLSDGALYVDPMYEFYFTSFGNTTVIHGNENENETERA